MDAALRGFATLICGIGSLPTSRPLEIMADAPLSIACSIKLCPSTLVPGIAINMSPSSTSFEFIANP